MGAARGLRMRMRGRKQRNESDGRRRRSRGGGKQRVQRKRKRKRKWQRQRLQRRCILRGQQRLDSGAGSSSGSTSGSGASSGALDAGGDGGALATGSMCPHVDAGDYEQYSLPATTGLPTGVTALTDWTQHPAQGGWYGAQQMDACRDQADPGGFRTWHGKASARLEVNPGDDPLSLGRTANERSV